LTSPARVPAPGEPAAAATAPAGWPVMHQDWRHLLFVHWRVPKALLQRLLPSGLDVDTFDGQAYVGLVPFTIRGVRPPGLPALPLLSAFHEVNLRTYVHRRGRDHGVWFFSLDAASRLAVVGARAWYRLAYHFARIRMTVEEGPLGIQYSAERHWPGPPARCRLRYGPLGKERTSALPRSLDHFLVERYLLYARSGGRLLKARVSHAPYPLQRAEVGPIDETLSAAAGLPGPGPEPLLHYSSGVSVRVFGPEAVT
jgi:uncharacterized protein YqjF (DUF2071 family)